MMFNDVAFYIGDTQILWHGIIIGIAVIVSVLTALILRFAQGERAGDVLLTAAFSCILCPILARIVYWYCCSGQFSSFGNAVTDYSHGGFSLIGTVAGVFLSLLLMKFFAASKSVAKLADSIIPAGILGIAIARLAGFFTSADKGKMIIEDEALHKLPFSFPVATISGGSEWRIPTFLYESAASFLIFIIAVVIFISMYSDEKKLEQQNNATVSLLSISLFSLVQSCLESMRYDTLYMRSNGFVSLVQIIFMILALIPYFVFLVRIIKNRNFKIVHIFTTILMFGLVAAAGYMEYLVQRYADKYVQWYSIMFISLILVFIIICHYCADSIKKQKFGKI